RSYTGPALDAVLGLAGGQTEHLRGKALAQYLVVEARDGYRVAFGVAELGRDFTARRIILAHSLARQALTAQEGPWRLAVEGELRPARWVRQVSALRLRMAPE